MSHTTERPALDATWHHVGYYAIPITLVAMTVYAAALTLAGIPRPALLTALLAALWAGLTVWSLIQAVRYPRAAYGWTAAVASIGLLITVPALTGGVL